MAALIEKRPAVSTPGRAAAARRCVFHTCNLVKVKILEASASRLVQRSSIAAKIFMGRQKYCLLSPGLSTSCAERHGPISQSRTEAPGASRLGEIPGGGLSGRAENELCISLLVPLGRMSLLLGHRLPVPSPGMVFNDTRTKF